VYQLVFIPIKLFIIFIMFEALTSLRDPSSVLQEERLAKLLARTGGGAIKRKKRTEEVDKKPLPARVSNEQRIHELLRNMYGDRKFLDDVVREAG